MGKMVHKWTELFQEFKKVIGLERFGFALLRYVISQETRATFLTNQIHKPLSFHDPILAALLSFW